MADVGVKLTGDNSEFIAMMKGSLDQAGKFSGDIVGKTSGKLFELRDISTALASALGINITSIAENAARLVAGLSKETEEALKNIVELTGQTADKNIATMRAAQTEEQRYQADLKARNHILNQIAEVNKAIREAEAGYIDEYEGLKQSSEELKKNEQRRVEIHQLENQLSEVGSRMKEHEKKIAEDLLQREQDRYKILLDASEKEFDSQTTTLSSQEKINALRVRAVTLALQLYDVSTTQSQADAISEAVQKRLNDAVAEEGKLRNETHEIIVKNSLAEEEANTKAFQRALDDLSIQAQRAAILKEIAKGEEIIDEKLSLGLDASNEIKQVDELRAKLKENEKKLNEGNVELAKLLLKGSESLTSEDKLRLQILQGQVTQKQIDKEISDLTAKAISGQITPAEKERLSVLVGQSEEYKKQLATLQEQLGVVVTISRSGKNYEDQTTAALEGVRDRVKSQLDQVRQRNALAPLGQKDPTEIALQSEYQQIVDELAARKNIGDYANRFGEDAARGKYGDTLTDRALRDMKDVQTQTLTAIQMIQQQLASTFHRG